MSDCAVPPSLRDQQKRDLRVEVSARALENQAKEADVTLVKPEGDTFTIRCDEGEYMGGGNIAPPPLAYFSAAIAF